jgi:peptide/nickel transport system substrate-binding protein
MLIAAGILGMSLVAAACGGGDDDDTSPTTGSENTAAPTSAPPQTDVVPTTAAGVTVTPGGTLRVGVEADTNGWVPAIMQCDSACQIRARTFFEPLFALDQETNLLPYLAESAEPNADYTEWTVELRDGITFHDGEKLDAAAAVKNLQRSAVTGFIAQVFSPVVGSGAGKPAEGVGFEVVDDLTFKAKMSKPWATFPYALTTQGAFMSSPKWLDTVFANPAAPDTVAGAQPVGTGPFVFDSWKPGDTLTVKKNASYWHQDADGNALPYLDGIEFRVIADELTRAKALEAGDLDFMPTDNGENIKKFREEAKDGKYFMAEQSEYGETFHILLNVGQEGSPLQSQDVRCGLTAATDSKVLAETTGAGVFPVANGPFSPGQQGYLDDTGNQTFDMDKAKELIKKWSDANGGQKPKIIYSTVTDSTALQTAQLVQQWWEEAGADVEIAQIEQQKLILNALLGDPAFNAFGWRNHAGLILDNQYIWWHSSGALPPGAPALNFGRMKDPVIDEKLDAARAEADPAKAKTLAEDVNRQFAKECWLIPTTWAIWGLVGSPKIQGIGTSTFGDGETILRDGAGFPGQVWFKNVWLEQ